MRYESKQELTDLLGSGHKTARNNMAFKCPFQQCPSRLEDKQKLEVNLDTGQWHCWVCNTRGKSLKSLFYSLNKKFTSQDYVPTATSSALFQDAKPNKVEELTLPKEFKPLHKLDPLGFYGKKALAYAYSRGVTDEDIITYNIGYCEEGSYDGYLIIPNYNESGILNYFTTRTFIPSKPKTRNPPSSRKDIIGFEFQLNWNLPVILVESALNAITIKYNASPLYGSNLLDCVVRKLYEKEVSEVIFCWDRDAYEKSVTAAATLAANGIRTKVVKFPLDQDANNLGHDQTWQLINSTPFSTFEDLEYTRLLSKL